MKNKLTLFTLMIAGLGWSQQHFVITFPHADKIVNGVLSVPAGEGPFRTIILAPGSGANDKDATMVMSGANVACLYPGLVNTTLRPYRQLGDALVKGGYAVLRYDKLEYTYSGNLGAITFEKLWLPFQSAIDYVKTRPEVDTNGIILLGHSEGAALIPYVAKSRTDIKALISVAGARTPFDSLLCKQILQITQQCGGNMTQAQAQVNQILAYYNDIRTNAWNSSTPALFGVPAAAWADYVAANDPVSGNYDQCLLPTLFLGMGLDFNVPPAELIRFQNEVSSTNDFWSIPDVNHYMTRNDDPNLDAAVADTILYWLKEKGFTTGLPALTSHGPKLELYPNPVSSDVEIGYANKYAHIEIVVMDAFGRTVFSGAAGREEERRIHVSQLPAGVYVVKVKTEGKLLTQKFIKQ